MRPRGKGRKLAWQGASHENTKGTAQLRSFFRQRGQAGLKLVHHPNLHIEAMNVGGDEDENIGCVLSHEEDEEIQHSQHSYKMTSD